MKDLLDNKQSILVISDLHFSEPEYGNVEISRIQSENGFEQVLINELRASNERYSIGYLVIAGDIADSGTKREFQEARKFLEKLCKELEIRKDNILVVPGNHDFDRGVFKYFLESKGIGMKDSLEYQEDKFKEYVEFYNSFFEKKKKCRLTKKAIVDVLFAENLGVVFLGINTCYKDSFREFDHIGYIEPSYLENDLNAVKKEYPAEKLIAVMHHSPEVFENEKRQISNWDQVQPLFERYNVNTFIAGHMHTSDGERVLNRFCTEYLTCGSLGVNEHGVSNFYLILNGKEDNEKRSLKPILYKYEGGEYNDNSKYWQEQTNKNNILNRIVIDEKRGNAGIEDVYKRIKSENGKGDSPLEHIDVMDYALEEINDLNRDRIVAEANEFILNTIRNKHLFKTGHYHWSTTGNTLSYVDTNVFFENNLYLENVKTCFKSMFSHYTIEPDLILGYEMNGNILGFLLATEYRCDFSYLSSHNRGHFELEEALPDLDNCQRIAIIVDFLYKDYLAKQLIRIVKKKYKKISHLFVMTLIYGTDSIDECKGNHVGVECGEKSVITNICFVYKIPMVACTFSPNKCEICNRKLAYVHEMYSSEI